MAGSGQPAMSQEVEGRQPAMKISRWPTFNGGLPRKSDEVFELEGAPF